MRWDGCNSSGIVSSLLVARVSCADDVIHIAQTDDLSITTYNNGKNKHRHLFAMLSLGGCQMPGCLFLLFVLSDLLRAEATSLMRYCTQDFHVPITRATLQAH